MLYNEPSPLETRVLTRNFGLPDSESIDTYLATGGYLHQVGRLPDFLGADIFAGGWIENGDAFDDFSDATWRTNVSGGIIADTLVGPIIVATSAGGDGRFRFYLGAGRLFR